MANSGTLLSLTSEEDYDFAGDFLYFFENRTNEKQSDREASLLARLSRHGPGRALLDLGCGAGRIANRLAARGGEVVGLDRSQSLVDHGRAGARRLGVATDYVVQDMRDMAFDGAFDTVVSWYSSFGYFDDEANLSLLKQCRRALRPRGRLLLEVNNRDELLRNYSPSIVVRRGEDLLVDENSFDPSTARTTIRRTIIRDRRLVSAEFSIRLYAFNELREILLRAGFGRISVLAGDGSAFHARSPRMILTARAV